MHVGTFWNVELPVEGEAILRRFEEAWQGPAPPDLDSFLPIRGEYPTSLLLHLISVDLDFRLRNGEPAKVEHYLERHPALASEPEALLNLIALEYSLRQCWGVGGTPEEYLLRFPPLAEPLRVRLSNLEDEPGREVTEPPGVWPVIPGYVIQRELGRGGMGVVYQAKQDALGRVVALKTILPTCVALKPEINRFHRETEAIARLDHPQIVPIYEVGEYDGRPFFSMKYYPGGSLSQRVDGPSADPHAHARLVEVIARAVHHAHQRGVLHRDIKPSNILLDESGQPHVADFGLAKRFDREASATAGSALVGTPGYISPEQAQGSRAVTTVSDVYGLGAVLYELLTGEPPFRAGTALATLFQVVESTPRQPSRMNPVVPPDLETICLKCLEKEPSRRYPSAWDLAEDLRRWRNGDSIRARPASAGERAWRWTRRHPVVATLSLVTGLALLLVIVTLAMSNARISAQEVETARALAQERRALGREQRLLYVERIAAASQLWSSNHLQLAEPLLDECPPRFRHHWEWKFLNAFRRPYLNSIAHEEMVTALAYAPRQRYLASATSSGQVKLWDSESGRPLPCAMHHGNFVTGLTFSPDGRHLATADRGGVKVWDVATGTLMFSLAGSFWAEFSPDGRHLASALGRDVKIWDAQTGQELHTFLTEMRSVRHGSFSPDSSQLAVGGAIDGRDEHSGPQGVVELWNVPDGRRIGESHKYDLPIHSVVYAADEGSLLLGQGNSVLLTEASSGLVRRRIDTLMFSRARLQVSPNRRYLAYALSDRTVRVLDVQTWQDVLVLRGHRVEVDALTFSPDGRRLASGGKDRTVKVWDLAREAEVRVLAPVKPATGGVAFHSRGTLLALASDWTGLPADQDAAVRVLDPSTGREVLRMRGCNDVAFGPNGDWLATGTPEGLVTLWDTATGREIRTIGDPAHASYRLAVSQDGRRLFSGSRDGTIHVWDPSDGSLIATWRGDSGRIEAMALSPDGSRLATTGPESGVRLWDTETGIRVRTMEDPSSFSTVAISPDGRLVAAAGIDQVIRLWELSTGRPAGALHGHSDKVNKVAFSPDGRRLVSASSDGSARLWDLEFGRELLALPGVSTVVSGIAFSPNGLRIAATDFHLKIWDVTSSRDGVAIGDNDENSLN